MNIFKLIHKETERQNRGIELIASENYASKNVMAVQGSILTAKYAEGYPGKRYYGGCEIIDQIEQEAIDSVNKLFGSKYANVQPHSGSQANAAAYRALDVQFRKDGIYKNRKMRILTAELNDGAHLTHSSPVSFVTNLYNVFTYKMGKDGKMDISLVEKRIEELIKEDKKPDVLLLGFSAYPFEIDFKIYKELADKYELKVMTDMAHIAGLVAAGRHSNPVPYSDIVTSTTHKTLRGPRGGIILTNDDNLIKRINAAVFPFYQGGPLMHIIGAKAVCFQEAAKPEFKRYIEQVIFNTKYFAESLQRLGATCTMTDNHLMLLDTKKSYNLLGKDAQVMLEEIGITTNKNMLPGDKESPKDTSGLRIGFAAITSRGCHHKMAMQIAIIINSYLTNEMTKIKAIQEVNKLVLDLTAIETLEY